MFNSYSYSLYERHMKIKNDKINKRKLDDLPIIFRRYIIYNFNSAKIVRFIFTYSKNKVFDIRKYILD